MGSAANPSSVFGKSLRDKFLFDGGWVNLNHGSFGTYPRAIRERLRHYQDLAEARPDQLIRYDGPRLLDESRAAVAEVMGAPVEAVTFVQNATTGTNTVLRALEFTEGDYILYCDTIYGACEKTVQYICETTPAQSVKLDYHHPVEDDDLVRRFEEHIIDIVNQKGGRVKVAVFDTVSSLPGLRVPWEALTAVCKKHQVLSLVDGAHGVGMIELDLQKTDPDFFVSNCHKWLYAPRGCAVLYVPVRNQHLIRSTLPTSHGFVPRDPMFSANNPLPPAQGKSAYVVNFEFVGTLDNAPFFCVKDAIKWREEVLGGEDKIREYCFNLAHEAADKVAEILGTHVMTNKTKTLQDCCLFNVKLPLTFDFEGNLERQASSSKKLPNGAGPSAKLHRTAIVPWMNKEMIDKHKTFIPVVWYKDALWTRLSAQVYLDIDDFVWGGKLLKKLCEVVLENGIDG